MKTKSASEQCQLFEDYLLSFDEQPSGMLKDRFDAAMAFWQVADLSLQD